MASPQTEEFFDLIASSQSRRLDDQRANVGNLPGLRITHNNLGHLRVEGDAQEPGDEFFNMLMKCQVPAGLPGRRGDTTGGDTTRGDTIFSPRGKNRSQIPPAQPGGAVARSCPPAALGTQAGASLWLQGHFSTPYWGLRFVTAPQAGGWLETPPPARCLQPPGPGHCSSRSGTAGPAVLAPGRGARAQQCRVPTPALLPAQSSRIDDQRCAPPDSIPRGPTMPDEDFFSLIQRVQAKRMDEQRVDLASAQEEAAEEQHRPGSS